MYDRREGSQPSFTMLIKVKKKTTKKHRSKSVDNKTFGPKSPYWSTADQTTIPASILC